jgi:hypothetical protein
VLARLGDPDEEPLPEEPARLDESEEPDEPEEPELPEPELEAPPLPLEAAFTTTVPFMLGWIVQM